MEDWTFFDRGGNTVTVSLDPGSGTAGGPSTPYLEWAQVQLIDPTGKVLKSITSTVAGAILKLSNVALPADGTYTIAVTAAPSQQSSVGNYVVAAYDVTPDIQSLNVNQVVTGNLPTPYSIDQWTFSASANTQVKFLLQAESASGLAFSLTGPNGFNGFTNITGSSALDHASDFGNLHSNCAEHGRSDRQLRVRSCTDIQTSLSLGTPYNGTFAGSGQPQLFAVNVPAAGPLSLQLTDPTAADHIELYAQFGTPPTRQFTEWRPTARVRRRACLSRCRRRHVVRAGVSPIGTQPAAHSPSWPMRCRSCVTAVTPVKYGTNSMATLTLNGAGFTTLDLGRACRREQHHDLSGRHRHLRHVHAAHCHCESHRGAAWRLFRPRHQWQWCKRSAGGLFHRGSRRASQPGNASDSAGRDRPAPGLNHLRPIRQHRLRRHARAGAPARVDRCRRQAAVYSQPRTLVSGLWTTALGQGYSNTIEILASGNTPGVLEPGESMTVPVYYAGMQQPWNFNEAQFHFDIRIFTTSDSDAVNWAAFSPPCNRGDEAAAWSVVYSNLTGQLGGTWGGYVQFLDNEAAYLGQLGENVTDISQLWGLGVQQANNSLTPVGPNLTSATDDAVAIPGSLSLSFSRVYSSSLSGRNTLGPLGYGWSTPWQTTATLGPDGSVTISGADGSQRIFRNLTHARRARTSRSPATRALSKPPARAATC